MNYTPLSFGVNDGNINKLDAQIYDMGLRRMLEEQLAENKKTKDDKYELQEIDTFDEMPTDEYLNEEYSKDDISDAYDAYMAQINFVNEVNELQSNNTTFITPTSTMYVDIDEDDINAYSEWAKDNNNSINRPVIGKTMDVIA